jgi:hypothetical protein
MTVPQAAKAIVTVPIFNRRTRSRRPSAVTHSLRRLQSPARPPENASRKNAPKMIP